MIKGETSEFLPSKMIARKEPYVLFLDELNACSKEVQKAFYSLIHERRIGEYHLPKGSSVIGAGNRAQDSAIVKNTSSALVNRIFHVQMKADPYQWFTWTYENNIRPWIIDYIGQRPDHLFSEPPKTGETYSTPRSWHLLSDAKAYDARYMLPEVIAGRVEVKGRGGTKLQAAVDHLENANDYPKDGSILIITDGEIEDKMKIHHDHAFLIPKGKRLSFVPKGKVICFEDNHV